MTELTALLGEMFLAQIVQITLLILLVGLTARLFLHNRPFPALALWIIVLVKCVTPPVIYSPSGMFCWIDVRDSVVESTDYSLDAQVLPDSLIRESRPAANEAEMFDDVAATVGAAAERTPTSTIQWHSVALVI